MAKYLLLKHYRGGARLPSWTSTRWTSGAPVDFDAHIQCTRYFATRLTETGEYVNDRALSPEGTFVRYGGEGRPPKKWPVRGDQGPPAG